LGVELDAAMNEQGGPQISQLASQVSVWVIPTNEEFMIAHYTKKLISLASEAINS
jgi:acetate kinase